MRSGSTSAPLLLRALGLAAATLVVAACDQSPTGPSIRVGTDVTLAPGATVHVTDTSISLRFEAVDGDSRCPGDALCLTGGDAVVRVAVSADGTESRLELHTGNPQPARHGRYMITLVELSPYPFSSRPPIAPGDYRVTLRVTGR